QVYCISIACGENGAQLRAIKPGDRVDRDEEKDQSSLAEQARACQKKRARGRIHEIVLTRAKEIDLTASEHVFASGVPEFVIKNAVAAEVSQERKHGKDSRRHDKSPKQSAPHCGSVHSAIQGGPQRHV